MIALLLAGFLSGLLNAVAGGGPIVAISALIAVGLPPSLANMTSTVSLFPGQIATGWHARASLVAIEPRARRRLLLIVSVLGGSIGAALLLLTPSRAFALAVPWLVLFATLMYLFAGRSPTRADDKPVQPPAVLTASLLAIYGGYYGGGNSFMVLAMLGRAGFGPRAAAHAKNLLICAINAAAAATFLAVGAVPWSLVLPVAAGALAGSFVGLRIIDGVPVRALRWLVGAVGLGMSGWLMVTLYA